MAPSGFFNMSTSMEVITAIATSGQDTNAVRQAVIMYIVAKKKKGYSEQYIHEKLEKLEVKFMHIEALHPAWRDARALFQLRKSDHIPIPMSIVFERENEERRQLERESSSMALSSPVASSASTYTSSSASMYSSSSASMYSSSSASMYSSSSASTYTPSSASTYTLSSGSTRPSSVPSIASVMPTANSPPPLSWDSTSKQDESGYHSSSHDHRSRRDTALSSLSEYSDDSEPDEQVFILPSGNPQN
ncbi:uncharacterized protein F5147DRAFT_778685 [Suillus discolor]|uniref:Uncharacterized protein n=1 Tax=Suillus discolor TaxID=1912936 RepID=A0A9P7EYQ3_9AGAM|nr:uncharacterized protein F5147DRAFT_778685 [Suillus discolor]KAG2095474.1 hypothetical protein F5147DRAFT_778685 [Suillus discolor]